MKSGKDAVREFMSCIIIALVIYIPAVTLIYLIAGKLSLSVPLGALYGSAVTALYYYLFARAMKSAADNGESPEDVKKRIQAAYSLRMFLLVILMGAGLAVSVKLRWISWLPMLLALLVPRIAIAVYQIKEKKRGTESEKSDE